MSIDQRRGSAGTPLKKKLGLKENFIIRLIDAPEHYVDFFIDWPAGIKISDDPLIKKNLIHFFPKDFSAYFKKLPPLKEEILQNGMIWISWPKRSSKISSEMSEELIRQYGLKTGLVDVKICSVNEDWSALKFVIPVKSRK